MTDRTSSYIDDMLIYSKTWEDHMNHIEEVLGRLERTGLTVKRSNCEWGKEDLEFLGNCMGKSKVCIPEARVRDMTSYARPVLKKDVRAFLVSKEYYRRIIPHYGSVAATPHQCNQGKLSLIDS